MSFQGLPQTAKVYYNRLSPHITVSNDIIDGSVRIYCKVCKTTEKFEWEFNMRDAINEKLEYYSRKHRHSEIDNAGDEDYSYVLMAAR